MQQYWYAYEINTEEAWLAVETNFDQKETLSIESMRCKAKQRLAEFYRENDEPERAMDLYIDLAKLEGRRTAVGGRRSDRSGQPAGSATRMGAGQRETGCQAVQLIKTFTPDQQRDVLMLLDPEVLRQLPTKICGQGIEKMVPERTPEAS